MKAALTLNPSPKGGEGLRVRASPKKGEGAPGDEGRLSKHRMHPKKLSDLSQDIADPLSVVECPHPQPLSQRGRGVGGEGINHLGLL